MPGLPDLHRAAAVTAWAGLTLGLVGCGQPDTVALKRLACEQAGANLDLQSLSQLDTLRKALGLARDVDPIGYCRSIGARLETPGAPPASTAAGGEDSE